MLTQREWWDEYHPRDRYRSKPHHFFRPAKIVVVTVAMSNRASLKNQSGQDYACAGVGAELTVTDEYFRRGDGRHVVCQRTERAEVVVDNDITSGARVVIGTATLTVFVAVSRRMRR